MNNQPSIKEVKQALIEWQKAQADKAPEDLKGLIEAISAYSADGIIVALETAFPERFPSE